MTRDEVIDRTPSFECPRCSRTVVERFYGPCALCRNELRVRFAGQGRVIDLEAFEPKMNVTPNAVALRDDD